MISILMEMQWRSPPETLQWLSSSMAAAKGLPYPNQPKFLNLETEIYLHAHAHTLFVATRTIAERHQPSPQLRVCVSCYGSKCEFEETKFVMLGRMIVFVRFFLTDLKYVFFKKIEICFERLRLKEKNVGEGLIDDSKEGSQCLIYVFFLL